MNVAARACVRDIEFGIPAKSGKNKLVRGKNCNKVGYSYVLGGQTDQNSTDREGFINSKLQAYSGA